MREHLSRMVCLLTLVVAVGLAYLFAVRHNPLAVAPTREATPATPAAPTEEAEAIISTRGADLFAHHNCTSCHAIAGRGNPRYPLDDTGEYWTEDELRHWVVGTGEVTAHLSDVVRRRKQGYLNLPEEDLQALVAYLSTLRSGGQ